MDTEELLNALKACKGAIEPVSIFPIFSHFCFDGDLIYTYDDVCAVVQKFHNGMFVGIRADVLLGVLETLGDEVRMDPNNEGVKVRSGKVKVDLPSLPKSSFMFEAPKEDEWEVRWAVSDKLIRGFELCGRTVGDDAMHREFTGVTLIYDALNVSLYSSDDIQLSKFVTEIGSGFDAKRKRAPFKDQWLLPARACALFVEAYRAMREQEEKKPKAEQEEKKPSPVIRDRAEAKTKPVLYLSKEWVKLSNGELSVYSKTMAERPPDYEGIVKTIAPKLTQWQPMPPAFGKMVQRAEVLVAKDSTAGVVLNINGKTIEASLDAGAGTTLGTFAEKIMLAEDTGLTTTLTFSTSKLAATLNALAGTEDMKMSISERCFGLQEGGYMCLVAPTLNRG